VVNPAQSTYTWSAWPVQSQLNQYLASTLSISMALFPVLIMRICGCGLLVLLELSASFNCRSMEVITGPAVNVYVGVGINVKVFVAVGGTAVLVEVGTRV
jgi:hypothetical protein